MDDMTAGQRKAAAAFLIEMAEMMASVGRHDGHKLSKAGRCVYCSCGYRYLGSMPSAKDVAEAREAFAQYQASREEGRG